MSFVVASSPFFWLLLPDQEDKIQAFFSEYPYRCHGCSSRERNICRAASIQCNLEILYILRVIKQVRLNLSGDTKPERLFIKDDPTSILFA